ncbi:MAG: alanyl-tRNA editing protein [Lachnospiraceae bacterium]|nr:alanyl-tRNA editing protein [Lachnospiraceae bacterium]
MEKLYYENIHITEFEAIVMECILDDTNQNYQIVLNRTAFFPEEGGQLADKGTLNHKPVLDVRIKQNIIYHILKEPIPVGTKVWGQVNWEQRFDFMQQHSGEHIISGLVNKYYGYDNVGFHLGLTEVTLDFNGVLSLEQLRMIEQEANAMVWQNLPIQITYPSPKELSTLQYRSKLDLTENVRIITIPGVDVCACCAPHVDTTGQIGLIKITNVQSHRGGVRVNILCGGRAVNDYTQKQDSVSNISTQLSAKQNAVSEAVARLKEEHLRLKALGNDLQAKLLGFMAASLPSPEDCANAILFLDTLNEIAIRNTINELVTVYTGYCAAFIGNDMDGYRFIIGSASKDCCELAKSMRQTFQAKGGGTAPMIQGTVSATRNALEEFFTTYCNEKP